MPTPELYYAQGEGRQGAWADRNLTTAFVVYQSPYHKVMIRVCYLRARSCKCNKREIKGTGDVHVPIAPV